MTEEVKAWTESCPQCVCSKTGPDTRAPLVPIQTSYPFEVIGMDYLSLGRPEDRYPYILVITDLFSKYAVAVPTKDQTANTTARAFYEHFIRTFGCPEHILTDRRASFESSLLQELCKLYGFNQTLIGLLGSLAETGQAQWPDQLPALLQAYNNTVHSTSKMTPHFVVFRRHARLPIDWVTGLNHITESYTLQDQARYNRRTRWIPLLPGERVLVRNFQRRAKGKLTPKWSPEPFVVVTQLRKGLPVYVLWPEGKEAPTRTVHYNNLRPCPLGVLQENPTALEPGPIPCKEPPRLPPPTCWLPGLVIGTQQSVPPTIGAAQNEQPEPPCIPAVPRAEQEHPNLRRSQQVNLGRPPVRYQ
uniref:Integrase catalytic domain-containing protein n=1 Tax=Oryzias latipes TaxID=8090 RepID=A0A3B3H496_ORYLA